MRRHLPMLLVLAVTISLEGCSLTGGNLLGMHNGYLLTTFDTLALPGEAVDLQVLLEGGQLLRDKPGYVARFYEGGELFKAAETDDDGVARASFQTQQTGDHLLMAGFSPNGFAEDPPPPAELLVACRPADAPIVVVDLDRTLVASRAMAIVMTDAQPMPGSLPVMQRIAGQYTVVYLTHRPQILGVRTRQWLTEHGYPRCVLLMADSMAALGSSEKFKGRVLGQLHQRFTNMRYGIGDKSSDMRVYADNGMAGILLMDVAPDASPDTLWEKVRDLQMLPEHTQVVWNWQQVEQAIFDGSSFPAQAVQRQLMDLAAQREREKQLLKAQQSAGGPASQPSSQGASGPLRQPSSAAAPGAL